MNKVHQSVDLSQHSKLVPIDKLSGRKPWYYLNGNNPHEKRFLSINKCPDILSTVKHSSSPEFRRFLGRKEEKRKLNTDIIYNPNYLAIMANTTRNVPDFKKQRNRSNNFLVNTTYDSTSES